MVLHPRKLFLGAPLRRAAKRIKRWVPGLDGQGKMAGTQKDTALRIREDGRYQSEPSLQEKPKEAGQKLTRPTRPCVTDCPVEPPKRKKAGSEAGTAL